MERPSPLSNLWLLVQTFGWVIALEGVAEFVSERHYDTVLRRIIVLFLGGDPQAPRPPDNWAEWYYS